MPQLDLTIVFSQIFWLFIFFFLTYTVLTHFFLPRFLLSIKSRKKIIFFNCFKILENQKKLMENQDKICNSLNEGLSLIRNSLTSNWVYVSKTSTNLDFLLVDKKIGLVTFNTIKYCGFEALNGIFFYPRALNLK